MSSSHSPSKRRRQLLAAPLLSAVPPWAAAADTPAGNGAAASARKVLRVPFYGAETTLDPVRSGDVYSATLTAHIFETLYAFDHLARPVKLVPLLADGMPEVSADFRVWTVRIKRGIYFADDPAFKGQRRELKAADVAYGFQRILDPANKSQFAEGLLEDGILGLAELRHAALQTRKPFDYDAPLPGLQLLDSHTLRFTLAQPRPRFLLTLAQSGKLVAQARDAVDFYGASADEHPVGTGPFRLKQWVRSNRIVLERNTGYRERYYEAQPAADDVQGQAILAKMKGRRLPMVDEVVVTVIEETQPLWLSFLNAEIDGLVATAGPMPPEFVPQAVPGGQLAPHLAKRGIALHRVPRADSSYMYFNMNDPMIGGMTPDRIALRRALSLAYDVDREIRLIRRGQAIRAQGPMVPFQLGYDANYRSDMSTYDPARARALLDMYGYVDRNGDGWREMPDGSPLKIVYSTEPGQIYRAYNELWKKCMDAVNIRTEFETQQWPAHYKQAQAGSLQMWFLGGTAESPDGQDSLKDMYSPQAGQQNFARFKLPAFDAIYDRMLTLPDGPERNRLFVEAKRIAAVYMPYRFVVHRIANDLVHPWVIGYRRPVFWNEWWHMVDIDHSRRPAKT
jgi:ABC-type transport system substrate-binding protein